MSAEDPEEKVTLKEEQIMNAPVVDASQMDAEELMDKIKGGEIDPSQLDYSKHMDKLI